MTARSLTTAALTGALAAAPDRQDIVTFWFFAVVTGVGGGTLGDRRAGRAAAGR